MRCRASVMQGFYFLIRFDLALIYYLLKVYHKKSSSILLRKNMFNSITCIFFFKKHVNSQVFKDFSVENLEGTSSTFLSKFSSEIYLSLINYCSSIFTPYLSCRAFSLICFYPCLFFFLSFFFFFFFYWYFPWQTLTIHCYSLLFRHYSMYL